MNDDDSENMKIMRDTMKRALISIDYTVDFVAENGALTCGKPGQEIEQEMYNITKSFIEQGEPVVFAIDCHFEGDRYHPETKLYPPHNIKNTKGRDLFGSIYNLYENNKHLTNVFYMDKTRYSSFVGTDLNLILRERGITEVHLIGVCTDICVLHTAIDAYNHGYNVVIYEKAVASFDEIGHAYALKHMKNVLGAEIK